MEAEWQPLTRTEQLCLEQIVVVLWKLRRMERVEATLFAEASTADAWVHLLDRFSQAECRLERSLYRTRQELERMQGSRKQPEERARTAS